MAEIERLRRRIDHCDRVLTEAFEARMEVVKEILRYKRENGLPVLASGREAEVVRQAVSYLRNREFSRETEELFDALLSISKRYQARKLFSYNIVLIGFMGAGKTTNGEALARMLAMDFADTDAIVQAKLGLPVTEVFARHGEVCFRTSEKEAVREVSCRENTIIACGGGAVLDKENVRNLRRNGRLIWLKAATPTVFGRVDGDGSRPLLKGKMNAEDIDCLLRQREPYYQAAADITVTTDGKTVEEVCREIIARLLAAPEAGRQENQSGE
ncbi:MAG: shikimate kinase [bacterium]